MIEYSAAQEQAIKAIVEWFGDPNQMEFYLAGFAGTGKTTLVEGAVERICERYKFSNEYVRTAAYTGKAASVLRKKGIDNAQTIHSLIYVVIEDEVTGDISFELSELSEAHAAKLIVLDECSMVDKQLADDLRSFGKKILIMGDPGQLPPINGPGSFTNRNPDYFLHEIHRQAAESPIIELATMARQGMALPMGYEKSGVRILKLNNQNAELIHDENTQVICGLNRVRYTCTQRIRKALMYEGVHPQEGERIICCRNDRDTGLFNGALGILDGIEMKRDGHQHIYEMAATFDDLRSYKHLKVDPFLFKRHFEDGQAQKIMKRKYHEIDWGYVLTCHKAQGSGWRHVTIVDDSNSFRDDRWKWLYTAITRAEEGLVLLVRPSR